MSRCFVLGAGFSKAVAGLPLMKEMWDPVQKEIERVATDGGCIPSDAARLLNAALEELNHKAYEHLPKDLHLTPPLPPVDFEVALTYFDLNASKDREAMGQNGSGNVISFSTPPLELSDRGRYGYWLRRIIHAVLSSSPAMNHELLTEFIKLIESRDTVVTFNYDVFMDAALYESGKWVPQDGYGIPMKIRGSIDPEGHRQREVRLLKLHGSLNWRSLGDPLSLHPWHSDGSAIFKNLLKESGPDEDETYDRGDFEGMLPSYVKVFDPPVLINIWSQAAQALRAAQEIVFIGYSLPKADSAARVLFGTNGLAEKRLTIVDPNPGVVAHYKGMTGNQDARHCPSLDQYLSGARFGPSHRKQGS